MGGARTKYYADLDSWYDNVEDDKLIEKAKHHFDGYMQKHFHGWEGSGAKTSRVWTGSKRCPNNPFLLLFQGSLLILDPSYGIFFRRSASRRKKTWVP